MFQGKELTLSFFKHLEIWRWIWDMHESESGSRRISSLCGRRRCNHPPSNSLDNVAQVEVNLNLVDSDPLFAFHYPMLV